MTEDASLSSLTRFYFPLRLNQIVGLGYNITTLQLLNVYTYMEPIIKMSWRTFTSCDVNQCCRACLKRKENVFDEVNRQSHVL